MALSAFGSLREGKDGELKNSPMYSSGPLFRGSIFEIVGEFEFSRVHMADVICAEVFFLFFFLLVFPKSFLWKFFSMEIEGHDKIAPRNEPKRHFRFNCTALVAIISNNLEHISSHENYEYQ